MKIDARIAAIALVVVAQAASAQQLRGTITDSSTRQVVSGAIVMLLDSAGTTLARTIADDAGAYALPLRAGGRRVRVQRLGFRPITVALSPGQPRMDVSIMPIATYLQAVSVSASACPTRQDKGAAIALFDQARTGLLATVVAREANPARMVLYGFERTMDGTSDRISRQTVRVDSAASARVSFSAAITGQRMVDSGFVRETPWGRVFLGPDADVLLGESFATGYCFSLAQSVEHRPNQLGIAFAAARSRRDRVDIEGVLWLDTLKRSLVDLEFNYVGLPRREELLRPGGRVEFREMPNGAVLVDRWTLRLIGYSTDSVQTRQGTARNRAEYQVISKEYVTESGGELASARWRDGRSWHASLGALRVKAEYARGDGGRGAATGAVLALDETPYRALVGESGTAEFADLVPGPYRMIVVDSVLADVGVVIPTPVVVTALRDSVATAEVTVPTARDFIYQRCVSDKIADPRDSTRLLVRFMTHTGEPLDDVSWKVSRRLNAGPETGTSPAMYGAVNGHRPSAAPNKTGPGVSLGAYKVLRDGGRTGTDGMIQICVGGLYRGTQLLIQATRPGYEDLDVDVRLTGALQVLRLNLAPRQ